MTSRSGILTLVLIMLDTYFQCQTHGFQEWNIIWDHFHDTQLDLDLRTRMKVLQEAKEDRNFRGEDCCPIILSSVISKSQKPWICPPLKNNVQNQSYNVVYLCLPWPLHPVLYFQVELRLMKVIPNDFPFPKTMGLILKTSRQQGQNQGCNFSP